MSLTIVTYLYKGQPLFPPQNTNTTLYNTEGPKVMFRATWLFKLTSSLYINQTIKFLEVALQLS